jgi:uncharacterized membrane protein
MKSTPKAAQQNIQTVAELQKQVLEEGGASLRIADRIANFAGSMMFVFLHLAWFAIWVVINTGVIGAIQPFDPYPFILLSLIVSCEAVLISTFVLIKQNRMSRAADTRDHLNLQIDLLAEREATKILQMQRLICKRLGIDEASQDGEALELAAETAIDKLAGQIKSSILEE